VRGAGGVANREYAVSGRGLVSENVTSEADFDRSIGTLEAQAVVEITANSGALSRLDNVAVQPRDSGKQKPRKIRVSAFRRKFPRLKEKANEPPDMDRRPGGAHGGDFRAVPALPVREVISDPFLRQGSSGSRLAPRAPSRGRRPS